MSTELLNSTDYLWNFIIYSGARSDITTCIGEPDNLQSSKNAIRLLVPPCQPRLQSVNAQFLQFTVSVKYTETE